MYNELVKWATQLAYREDGLLVLDPENRAIIGRFRDMAPGDIVTEIIVELTDYQREWGEPNKVHGAMRQYLANILLVMDPQEVAREYIKGRAAGDDILLTVLGLAQTWERKNGVSVRVSLVPKRRKAA